MLFALTLTQDGRAILTDEPDGETLAVIEARTWQEARRKAVRDRALDGFDYVAGWGWVMAAGR